LSTDSSSSLKANKENIFNYEILTYLRKMITRNAHDMLIAVVVRTVEREEPIVEGRRRDKGLASIL